MNLVDKENIRDILTQEWFLDVLLAKTEKKELAKELSNMILSVPVAYDVEKVVEQVEQSEGACEECRLYGYECSSGHCRIKEIIDIIRAGGKE